MVLVEPMPFLGFPLRNFAHFVLFLAPQHIEDKLKKSKSRVPYKVISMYIYFGQLLLIKPCSMGFVSGNFILSGGGDLPLYVRT